MENQCLTELLECRIKTEEETIDFLTKTNECIEFYNGCFTTEDEINKEYQRQDKKYKKAKSKALSKLKHNIKADIDREVYMSIKAFISLFVLEGFKTQSRQNNRTGNENIIQSTKI